MKQKPMATKSRKPRIKNEEVGRLSESLRKWVPQAAISTRATLADMCRAFRPKQATTPSNWSDNFRSVFLRPDSG